MVSQSRSQTLQKQLQERHEQIEQTVVEMKTFENLRQHEVIAVPKRVEVCQHGMNIALIAADADVFYCKTVCAVCIVMDWRFARIHAPTAVV